VSSNKNFVNWLLIIILSIVWGSSFILMKKALLTFDNFQVASLRVVISFLFFLPVALLQIRKLPKKTLWPILAIGLCGSFIPAFLYTTAQLKLDSAPAGILNSLSPLFTFLWGIFLFRQKSSTLKVIGIVVGLLGAALLTISSGAELNFNYYALYAIAGTVLYGLSGNIAKHYLQDVHPVHITAVSFLFVGLPALAILFATDYIDVMKTSPTAWQGMMYVSILSIGGTALALLLYWKLVQNTNALFASIVAYVIPIVAVAWGLIDGERLHVLQLLGFALIIGSVFLVGKKESNTE